MLWSSETMISLIRPRNAGGMRSSTLDKRRLGVVGDDEDADSRIVGHGGWIFRDAVIPCSRDTLQSRRGCHEDSPGGSVHGSADDVSIMIRQRPGDPPVRSGRVVAAAQDVLTLADARSSSAIRSRRRRRRSLEAVPDLPRAQPVPEGVDPARPPGDVRGVLGAQGRVVRGPRGRRLRHRRRERVGQEHAAKCLSQDPPARQGLGRRERPDGRPARARVGLPPGALRPGERLPQRGDPRADQEGHRSPASTRSSSSPGSSGSSTRR